MPPTASQSEARTPARVGSKSRPSQQVMTRSDTDASSGASIASTAVSAALSVASSAVSLGESAASSGKVSRADRFECSLTVIFKRYQSTHLEIPPVCICNFLQCSPEADRCSTAATGSITTTASASESSPSSSLGTDILSLSMNRF